MDDARRRRFLQFFEEQYHGDRARLIRETEYTKGRVAQLFDNDQPFGERAGRNLAEKLELPLDYFERDRPKPGQLSAEAVEWAWRYERLSPGERQRLRLLYQVARDGVQPDIPPSPSAKKAQDAPESGLGDLTPPAKRSPKR